MMRSVVVTVSAISLCVWSVRVLATWQYEEVHDDFDDTTAYLLQVKSSVSVEGTDGQQHYPLLQLRCDKDGGQPYWRMHWFAVLDVGVSTNSVIGVVVDTAMQVRIDGKADNRMIWSWGDRDETLQGIYTYRVPAIVKALIEARELKVRIVGTFGKTHDATFDVSDLEPALEQLGAHCKRI